MNRLLMTSITAAKAAIEQGGGKVMNGPHQVPGGDWVVIVIAVDRQGAAFGVLGPQGAIETAVHADAYGRSQGHGKGHCDRHL